MALEGRSRDLRIEKHLGFATGSGSVFHQLYVAVHVTYCILLPKQTRAQLIAFIHSQQSNRFRVVDNTGPEKKIIGGQFPDIIFLQKESPPNNNVLYVFKIETNPSVDSVAEWKALGSVSSVFYIVVPRSKLDEARKLAAATGVTARFRVV